MSVPPDNNVGPTACAEDLSQVPPSTPEELLDNNSPGMAALLQALGLESCKRLTIGGGTIFPPGGIAGTADIGCEQISAISGTLNAVQKVLQCSLVSASASTSFTATQSLIIDITGKNYNVQNCRFVTTQTSNINVARYVEISTEIKQKMTTTLTTAMQQFIDTIKDQKTKGLFATPTAQKTIDEMQDNLNQMILQDTVTSIVQNEFQTYNNSGRQTIDVTNLNVCNNTQQIPTLPCFEVNQGFVLQILSQSILSSSLEQLLQGSAKADLTQILKDAQTGQSEGFTLPSFGGTAVVIVIIIIALALLFSKKPGGDGGGGEKEPVLAGKVGTIFGSILMVIGVILIIVGVVLKLKKTVNSILCYIMMAGGVILFIIGLVMLLRARSQQLQFQQNLAVANARAGNK